MLTSVGGSTLPYSGTEYISCEYISCHPNTRQSTYTQMHLDLKVLVVFSAHSGSLHGCLAKFAIFTYRWKKCMLCSMLFYVGATPFSISTLSSTLTMKLFSICSMITQFSLLLQCISFTNSSAWRAASTSLSLRFGYLLLIMQLLMLLLVFHIHAYFNLHPISIKSLPWNTSELVVSKTWKPPQDRRFLPLACLASSTCSTYSTG